MSRSLLLIFIALLSLFAGCDYSLKEVTPTYAFPLVNSRLTVYDLLAKDSSVISEGQDGQITLVYVDSLLELDNFKILRLVNQGLSVNAPYTGTSRMPFTGSEEYGFDFNLNYVSSTPGSGEELYKILYRAANLGVTINSSIQHTIQVDLEFPGLTKDGQPFRYSKTLTYNGQPHNATEQNYIGGYTLDLSRNGTTSNVVQVKGTIRITSAGGNLMQNENIGITIGLTAQNYEQVDAYIGQRTFPLTRDSILIRLFQFTDPNRTPAGQFALTDPQLTLRASNGFDIPFNVKINKLALKRKDNGQETPVLVSFQNPFPVARAVVPGVPVVTERYLNRDNSNIDEIITPVEKLLLVNADATSNPSGKNVNRIHKNSKLKFEAELKLPLVGYGYDWVLADTTELGFTAADRENVHSASLRLNMLNSLPIDADLQVYFLDADSNIVDSLLSTGVNFARSGSVNADGRVVQPSATMVDIDISPAKTKILFDSKFLVVYARLHTFNAENGQEVRIFSDNFLDIKIGMKLKVSL